VVDLAVIVVTYNSADHLDRQSPIPRRFKKAPGTSPGTVNAKRRRHAMDRILALLASG
jgi:hypothetical protein